MGLADRIALQLNGFVFKLLAILFNQRCETAPLIGRYDGWGRMWALG